LKTLIYTDSVTFLKEATGGVGPDLIIEMLANVNLETDMKIINRKGIIVVGKVLSEIKFSSFKLSMNISIKSNLRKMKQQ
jgi:hypothetical protein